MDDLMEVPKRSGNTAWPNRILNFMLLILHTSFREFLQLLYNRVWADSLGPGEQKPSFQSAV